MFNSNDDSVLVLIQLFGGNDGLNSVIPMDSYDVLMKHRGNVMIPEKKILQVNDKFGFHPSLEAFRGLYENDELIIINDVGYPLQNRSHFRSLDIWNSGSSSNEQLSSGWLGRGMDFRHSRFPNGYPNEKFSDPLAISMGNQVADVCQGKIANYSFVINSIESLPHFLNEVNDQSAKSSRAQAIRFLNETIEQTNQYNVRIGDIVSKGKSLVDYPEDNQLAQELKMVSTLLSGGIQTRVFHLILPGFDTHAYQTDPNSTETGMHARLLTQLSTAVDAFMRDLKKSGLHQKVLIATYSEFGRQIKSNSSDGTDHGDAAPMFLFGQGVSNSMIGNLPRIDVHLDEQAGVPMQFDFRDVFASIMSGTLGFTMEENEQIFGKKITPLPFV